MKTIIGYLLSGLLRVALLPLFIGGVLVFSGQVGSVVEGVANMAAVVQTIGEIGK
jgi:hypothetical protein